MRGDKLRREGQLRYQRGENTIVVFDDMNEGQYEFLRPQNVVLPSSFE